jgi:hypothetical protein
MCLKLWFKGRILNMFGGGDTGKKKKPNIQEEKICTRIEQN